MSPNAAERAFIRTRAQAADCRRCELWERATQAVFGEGPVPAPLMLVGEQPGDKEDIEGHPFVGPAGGILADALELAGIDRLSVRYLGEPFHNRNAHRISAWMEPERWSSWPLPG